LNYQPNERFQGLTVFFQIFVVTWPTFRHKFQIWGSLGESPPKWEKTVDTFWIHNTFMQNFLPIGATVAEIPVRKKIRTQKQQT